ncbi:MAG: Hsp70 family protein [Clostridia bacterium]|nr:Hsp70 family protein [Clostridia bacterium]
MSKKRIVGIDFGTSTSVMRVKLYNENGEPVTEELHTYPVTFNNNGSTMVPTVMRCKNDNYVYGFEALKNRRGSVSYEVFKLDLQSEDASKREQAQSLTERFFKYLYEEYYHQLITGCLGDMDCEEETIVSYPVKWNEATRDFMIHAAKQAGFKNVSGMNEAEAAIRAITVQCKDTLVNDALIQKDKPSNIMLIDMGAGTTDIVICRYTYSDIPKNEILTTWPQGGNIFFGGSAIDTVLKEYILDKFPPAFQQKMAGNIHLSETKEWKESYLSPALANGECVREFSPAENLANLLDISLEEFELNRQTFEDLFEDYIGEFVTLIKGALEDCETDAQEIDLVILTGGHSQWYFVRDVLTDANSRFDSLNLKKLSQNPKRVLSVGAPQETVALGLAFSKLKGNIFHDDCLSAYYYATGTGGYHKDLNKALQLYQSAAGRGNKKAIHNTGVCYYERKDYNKAVHYFTTASKMGYGESTFNRAVCYYYGYGVEEDTQRAKELFELAYEQGHAPAKAILGDVFGELQWEDVCHMLKPESRQIIDDDLEQSGLTEYRYIAEANPAIVKDFLAQFHAPFPLNEIYLFSCVYYGEVKEGCFGYLMTDAAIYVNQGTDTESFFRLPLKEIQEFRVRHVEEGGEKFACFELVTHEGKIYTMVVIDETSEEVLKAWNLMFQKLEEYYKVVLD